MGLSPVQSVPVLKGPIPHCLEVISKGRGASERLRRLARAIGSIAPRYRGLEKVFDEHLLSFVFNSAKRKAITEHLRRHWFDPDSPEAYFPNEPVAEIYAKGVLKTLAVALKGRQSVPIECWWILDSDSVLLLTLADVERGTAPSGPVTLLIHTPRPSGRPRRGRAILGKTGKAWVSRATGGRIVTKSVR